MIISIYLLIGLVVLLFVMLVIRKSKSIQPRKIKSAFDFIKIIIANVVLVLIWPYVIIHAICQIYRICKYFKDLDQLKKDCQKNDDILSKKKENKSLT